MAPVGSQPSLASRRRGSEAVGRPRVGRGPVPVALLLVLCLPVFAAKLSFTEGPLAGINELFDGVPAVSVAPTPVVCVICTRHPDTIREALREPPGEGYIAYLHKVEGHAERMTGLECLLVHYTQLEGDGLGGRGVKALLIAAMDKRISDEYHARLFSMIRATDAPTLGLCGGCQLMARAYGGKVGTMRELQEGETDPNPAYHPGFLKQWGFTPVRIVKRDPIFEGLGDEIVVDERHYQEIKVLPDEFEVLATHDVCRIQAIKHKTKLMYGTQFHPENYTTEHPAGEAILRSFFGLAGLGPKG